MRRSDRPLRPILLLFCMEPSIHKLQKQIARERKHLEWLERNLQGSKQHITSVIKIEVLLIKASKLGSSIKHQ